MQQVPQRDDIFFFKVLSDDMRGADAVSLVFFQFSMFCAVLVSCCSQLQHLVAVWNKGHLIGPLKIKGKLWISSE